SDPGNTAYRLKLLELAIETGDQSEAETQLAELRRSGDSDAIARAEAISASMLSAANPYLEDIEAAAEEPEPEPEPEPAPTPAAAPAEDLSGELADLADLGSVDGRDELVPSVDHEPDFLGLEIEDSPVEELDVSAEFDRNRGRSDSSDDDFVFADDGDPLSTKLDLARAYIDMGDDDGARQILEEVVAEGSDEQQQDARELLDRLG
ncbi:MAG: FimV/HubP family polar landmark protein, partial [Haliea sp.]